MSIAGSKIRLNLDWKRTMKSRLKSSEIRRFAGPALSYLAAFLALYSMFPSLLRFSIRVVVAIRGILPNQIPWFDEHLLPLLIVLTAFLGMCVIVWSADEIVRLLCRRIGLDERRPT